MLPTKGFFLRFIGLIEMSLLLLQGTTVSSLQLRYFRVFSFAPSAGPFIPTCTLLNLVIVDALLVIRQPVHI